MRNLHVLSGKRVSCDDHVQLPLTLTKKYLWRRALQTRVAHFFCKHQPSATKNCLKIQANNVLAALLQFYCNFFETEHWYKKKNILTPVKKKPLDVAGAPMGSDTNTTICRSRTLHSASKGREGSRTCALHLIINKDEQEMALQAQMFRTQTRIRQTEGITKGCIAVMCLVANKCNWCSTSRKG